MGHTDEPWHCNNKVGYVYGPDCVVARCGNFGDRELVKFNAERWNADARRITACVNACAGIPTEALAKIGSVAAILDRAHGALRGIDAADQTRVIPSKQLDAVSEAVAAIETFARERGIQLSEFAR